MIRRCRRCGAEHHAQGLCKVHYQRAVRRDLLDPSLASALRLSVDLRLLLDEPGWSIGRVATEAGVHRHTVVNVLRCRHRVQAATAARIATVCHTARSPAAGVRPAARRGQPVVLHAA